jgi:hypothetical protein
MNDVTIDGFLCRQEDRVPRILMHRGIYVSVLVFATGPQTRRRLQRR